METLGVDFNSAFLGKERCRKDDFLQVRGFKHKRFHFELLGWHGAKIQVFIFALINHSAQLAQVEIFIDNKQIDKIDLLQYTYFFKKLKNYIYVNKHENNLAF